MLIVAYRSLLFIFCFFIVVAKVDGQDFTLDPITSTFQVNTDFVPVLLNDQSNSAGVPSGNYSSYTVFANWLGPANSDCDPCPYSSETSVNINGFTAFCANGGNTNEPVPSLKFSGFLGGNYAPDIQSELELGMRQTFSTQDGALWTNIRVTLHERIAYDLNSNQNSVNFSGPTSTVVWVEINYDGFGSGVIVDGSGSQDYSIVGLYDCKGTILAQADTESSSENGIIEMPGLPPGKYFVVGADYISDVDNIPFLDNFLVIGAGSTVLDIDIEILILLGDVNGDGVVDLMDVNPFVNLIIDQEYLEAADMNEDGVVDLLDVQPFVQAISG